MVKRKFRAGPIRLPPEGYAPPPRREGGAVPAAGGRTSRAAAPKVAADARWDHPTVQSYARGD
eukprot:10309928-Heterocapsa_arctica.AAC.1